MASKTIIRDGEAVILAEEKLTTKHLWNLGESLIEDIAQDSVNKLDKKEWSFSNISPASVQILEKVLKRSRHRTWKKQIGHFLSTRGSRAAVAYIINGEIILDHMEVVAYKEAAYELEYIYLANGQVVKIDDAELPLFTHFKKDENGVVIKEIGYYTDEKTFKVKDSFTYPKELTRIPVEIIGNNERNLSDIGNVKMWDAIKELNHHANELGIEAEAIKAIWSENSNFKDSGEGLDEFLASGKRAREYKDLASKLGAPEGLLSPGGFAAVGPMAHINFIEDKIRKYTHTQAESTSSGTNKFNNEIDKFNQKATEYLDNKKEKREEDYTHFVSKLLELYRILDSASGISDEEIEDVVVELEISELEKAVLNRAEAEEENKQPEKEGE